MARHDRYIARLTDIHLVEQLRVTTKAVQSLTNEEYRQNELETLQRLQEELIRRFEDYSV